MKNLFLLDGASGTGKSDFLRYIAEFKIDGKAVHKITTRKKRAYEVERKKLLDLAWVTNEEFEKINPDFQYKYSGNKYGFSRESLNKALKESNNVFVIVRNAKIIMQLMKEYYYVNVVPVYIYTDQDLVVDRLRGEGYAEKQIQFRLNRLTRAFEDYLKHPDLYKETIINNSTFADYGRLIDRLLEKYASSPEVEDDLVFVLMSFDDNNPSLRDYYEAIKRSVTNASENIKCKRIDELYGSYPIASTAKRKIEECRLAIIDLTGNRPNVFYELGFTHGKGKKCVLTAHRDTTPQFYSNEYKIIYYRSAYELETSLTKHLSNILNT